MGATKHGRKRIKERMGINQSSSDRQAQLALERGVPHGETKGKLHKWISSCSLKYGNMPGVKYIVYNNKLFIFGKGNDDLITIYNIPSNLLKLASLQVKGAQERRK